MKTFVNPARGRLLISDPFLPDPNFSRTVLFVVEHNEAGTMAFVINRPLTLKTSNVLRGWEDMHLPLFEGGPVGLNTLHFIHQLPDHLEDAVGVTDQISWDGNIDTLKELLDQVPERGSSVKFFLGYSGWSPGQLEEELKDGSWIIAEAPSEIVFTEDPAMLWRKVMKSLGGQYAVLGDAPLDPQWN